MDESPNNPTGGGCEGPPRTYGWDKEEWRRQRDEWKRVRREKRALRRRGPRNRVGGAVTGLLLIAIGLLLGMKKLGIMTEDPFHQLWPFALIIIGAAQILGRIGHALSGWGVWLLLAGFWFLSVNFEIFGASHAMTGPVLIVITGLVLVLKALDGQIAVGAR